MAGEGEGHDAAVRKAPPKDISHPVAGREAVRRAGIGDPDMGKRNGSSFVRSLCRFGEPRLGTEFKQQGQTTL
jgi:hypothetical protein